MLHSRIDTLEATVARLTAERDELKAINQRHLDDYKSGLKNEMMMVGADLMLADWESRALKAEAEVARLTARGQQLETLGRKLLVFRWIDHGYGQLACRSCGALGSVDYDEARRIEKSEPHSKNCPWFQLEAALPPPPDVSGKQEKPMLIPPVAFLEMAIESLKDRGIDEMERQVKEFQALGTRFKNMELPLDATDAERGYLLGLETARVLVAQMPAAVLAGVTL